jgi:hypothetical protein
MVMEMDMPMGGMIMRVGGNHDHDVIL